MVEQNLFPPTYLFYNEKLLIIPLWFKMDAFHLHELSYYCLGKPLFLKKKESKTSLNRIDLNDKFITFSGISVYEELSAFYIISESGKVSNLYLTRLGNEIIWDDKTFHGVIGNNWKNEIHDTLQNATSISLVSDKRKFWFHQYPQGKSAKVCFNEFDRTNLLNFINNINPKIDDHIADVWAERDEIKQKMAKEY